MRIYLIGFMASGKSILGQSVAEKFAVSFYDTDQMIETQEGMSISGIFDLRGEKEFREIEAETVRQTKIYEKALIATGGGLPVHFDNMQWMNEHGITVYLSWPDEILKSNLLLQSSTRPLLKDLNEAEAGQKIDSLLKERKPFYEMASITLSLKGNIVKDQIILEKACKYIW